MKKFAALRRRIARPVGDQRRLGVLSIAHIPAAYIPIAFNTPCAALTHAVCAPSNAAPELHPPVHRDPQTATVLLLDCHRARHDHVPQCSD